MIDSHCHLNFEKLSSNLQNIINRCKENEVTKIISINTNPKEFKKHLDLIEEYNNVYIAYGIHPQEINMDSFFSFDDLRYHISNNKLIGLGETGLDFFHSIEFKKKQVEIFEAHIEASKLFDLPIIIHQRNSENEIIEILNNYKNESLKIVFHCFTGSENLLKFCLENNYYISLSGIVTFKNAFKLREIIANASLEYILLETDSPFLAPTPMRGQLNEPSYLKFTCQYLADFYKMDFFEFSKLTDNNFYKLFSKVKKDNKY